MKIKGAHYYHVDGIGKLFSITIKGKSINRKLGDIRSKIEDNTIYELNFIAKYLNIPERRKMNKEQLINEINKTEGKIQHEVLDSDSETDSSEYEESDFE
tara:strand:+ start:74 stop:373 length:300 start_codon:yes stop_codon:yes gene_type:complete